MKCAKKAKSFFFFDFWTFKFFYFDNTLNTQNTSKADVLENGKLYKQENDHQVEKDPRDVKEIYRKQIKQ